MRPGALLPGIFLLALAAAGPSSQQLREAEQAKAAQQEAQRQAEARAADAQAESQRLAGQRVAAAARLRELEDATTRAAGTVQALAAQRRETQEKLAAQEAALEPLLPLLERLSLYPQETLLALPLPPEQAVRGMLVLRGVARELEQTAAEVQAEQVRLAELQARLDASLPGLRSAEAAQNQAAAALDAQIEAARASQRAADDESTQAAARAAAEAARADNLRAVLAKIEAAKHAEEAEAAQHQQAASRSAGPGVGAPHGQLAAPVEGNVVRGFGEATEAGPATGVSYQAAPGARVVSPCGGGVVFAGPFRSFGLLMIVDCGGGYHVVLAGFQRLDARVGQAVQSGEPVGVMPGWDPQKAAARPSLYVELRRDGQPVNPAPFLRAKA